MRDVPADGFDAAVCMGNSFGYLDLAGTRAFVAALAAAVRPGGGLVIDYNAAAESILPGYTGEVGRCTQATSRSPPPPLTTSPAAVWSADTGSPAAARRWR